MRKVALTTALLCTLGINAQRQFSLADSLQYRVEMQATLSDSERTPFWLNANRYGLSSLEAANGYLRGAISRPLECDSARRWGIGYTVDVAVPTGFTSSFVVQQAFAEVRWLKGLLTVGSKEYPMELKNMELSTGSQTFGINARPIPQARLALPDYWTIPFTRGWVALKGHLAYGMTTDTRWQKDFTRKQSKYVEKALHHSKAGYLRIGPKNITLELGLEMACQFGGTTHIFDKGKETMVIENGNKVRDYFNALASGGFDATDSYWRNNEGNHLGSWVGRLNMDFKKWGVAFYFDRYFEDHSAMLFMDYDGYGSGAEWQKKKRSRYFFYDIKDMMLGAELKLKNCRWLNHIVAEYLYTKYQSGPLYHNNTISISDHISGRDDYYNHALQSGWQHWGMVMGNPLYMSPIYNDNSQIRVMNNRFVAWHVGVSGDPDSSLHYRLLATWQRGFGTYYTMYPDPRETVSLLAEASWTLPHGGWQVKGAVGVDSGALYGNNVGIQLTIAKYGLIK